MQTTMMISWTNRKKAVHHNRKVAKMTLRLCPFPETPKAKEKSSGRMCVTKSDDYTAVAGKLIRTDDSLQPSRDVSRTADQMGSQLECATEEDCLFGSLGRLLHRELPKDGSICCKDGS